MDFSLYTSLNTKIQELQLKLDAVILRLQRFQKNSRKQPLQLNTSFNPLDQYMAGGLITGSSCMPSPINKNQFSEPFRSQRWRSQPEESIGNCQKKTQFKQNILDSKSFNIVKRSLMINSQEIQQMKERLMEVENDYIKRISSLEEGFQVIARLSSLMEQKITSLIEQKQLKEEKVPSKKVKKRIIEKYQKKDLQMNEGNYQNEYEYRYI